MSSTASKRVVVAGATGLVGHAAVRCFLQASDCEVIAISRRRPEGIAGSRFMSVDLGDARSCAEAVAAIGGITHLVYAALHERPGLVEGWSDQEQIALNDRMLRNLLGPLEKASPHLRHVLLMQGGKAYGSHVRPVAIPAREGRSEMYEQPNFYWQHENYVRELQRGKSWRWTILRPQLIFGLSLGSAMNVLAAIGVYAALLRERGEPLRYPGGRSGANGTVDSDLLARAIKWAGEAEAAGNQVFNINNGDIFTWENVWPTIADAFGMEAGAHVPERLADTMPPCGAEWNTIREKYALAAPGLEAFVGESFQFTDFMMRLEAPNLVSTIKLRQAGFHEVMDTEDMLRKWVATFQTRKLLPPRPN
jgi:nucleoside-diphosphate-sugar epimerase